MRKSLKPNEETTSNAHTHLKCNTPKLVGLGCTVSARAMMVRGRTRAYRVRVTGGGSMISKYINTLYKLLFYNR